MLKNRRHLAAANPLEQREVEERRHAIFGEVAIPTLNAIGRRLSLQYSLGDDGVLDQIEVVRQTKARITGQAISASLEQ